MTSTVVNSSPRDIREPDGSLLAQGPYRALPATADTFARESRIDELAYVAGVDPGPWLRARTRARPPGDYW